MVKRKQPGAVAVVEDDAALRRSIQDLLDSYGIRAHGFPSAEEFLQSSHAVRVRCLILDYHLPGMSGLQLQQSLHAAGRAIPVIFVSAQEQVVLELQAATAQGGALAVLHKPFKSEELLKWVRVALGGRHKH
jgi:FixJ family two-component response regulator